MSKDELSDHAGVAIHPPILLALCLAVDILASWLYPLSFFPPLLSAVAGPILTVGSFGVAVWAARTMRKGGASIPTSKPTETIVVAGPYRYSRNPIYLAMVLLQVGLGLWANSLWFLALSPIFVAVLSWGVISREERYLDRKFGTEYSSYRRKVRRWI